MKSRFALLAVAASLLAAGCGGSGSNPTSVPTTNAYAGSYESTLTLDHGKRGDLALTVTDTGSASGTLTVSAGSALTRDPFEFATGLITVTGKVNSDGTFSFGGNDPTGGHFDVTGNLPANGNGTGSITVTAGGETYTSTIGVSIGTGSGSITFSAIQGANIAGTPFPSNPYVFVSNVPAGTAVMAIPSASDGSRVVGATVIADLPIGEPIPITGKANTQALATYIEGPQDDMKRWVGTSGSLTIVSRTATTIEIKFNSVKFEPNKTDNPGTGTFVINGTIKK